MSNKKRPGVNPQEINTCAVMAFREIGWGRDAMLTFTALMNIPATKNKENHDALNKNLMMHIRLLLKEERIMKPS